MSTDINSVALHPNKSCFAAGGQDFLMYKYDYNTGLEQGQIPGRYSFIIAFDLKKNLGHFV